MTLDAMRRTEGALSGLREWASRYDLIFCDVWGVVHDGVAALPGACDALCRFRSGGGTVVLVTNAPRPRAPIQRMLDRMHVPPEAYDAVVSSGDVTVEEIVARGEAAVHHIGPSRDLPLFEEAATRGAMPRRVGLAEADYVVCSGLYGDADLPESYDPLLADMKVRELPMICANPDIVVHAGETIIWCAGALAARYAAIGGPVTLIGKPHALIYQAARRAAVAVRGAAVATPRTLAIGDGMFTDMIGARDQGIDALLVTSGIHRDRIRVAGADGRFAIEPAAYADLAAEAGVTPTGHIDTLTW